MAVMATKFDVFPPIEEWDIDPDVCSQVYQLLKGFKQLWDVNLWADNTSLSNMGMFQNQVKKTLPQVVIAPYFLRNCSSHKSR